MESRAAKGGTPKRFTHRWAAENRIIHDTGLYVDTLNDLNNLPHHEPGFLLFQSLEILPLLLRRLHLALDDGQLLHVSLLLPLHPLRLALLFGLAVGLPQLGKHPVLLLLLLPLFPFAPHLSRELQAHLLLHALPLDDSHVIALLPENPV